MGKVGGGVASEPVRTNQQRRTTRVTIVVSRRLSYCSRSSRCGARAHAPSCWPVATCNQSVLLRALQVQLRRAESWRPSPAVRAGGRSSNGAPSRRRRALQAGGVAPKTRSALRTPTWWIQEPGAVVPPGDAHVLVAALVDLLRTTASHAVLSHFPLYLTTRHRHRRA